MGKCNTNCAVCISLVQCQLCREGTIHRNYLLQPDGSCLEVASTFLEKYYWLCVSMAMFIALLLCFGLVLLCQCLCDFCCRKSYYEYETDSEGDIDSERRVSGWR